MNVNKVVLFGNLAFEPKVKELGEGKMLCDIRVAVSTYMGRTPSGEVKKETSFIDCTCFGWAAKQTQLLGKKGSRVLITGRLRQETWEKDGKKHSRLGVTVDECCYVSAIPVKEDQNHHSVAQKQPAASPATPAHVSHPPKNAPVKAEKDEPFAPPEDEIPF